MQPLRVSGSVDSSVRRTGKKNLPKEIRKKYNRIRKLQAEQTKVWHNAFSNNDALIKLAGSSEEGSEVLDRAFEIADELLEDLIGS